MRYSRTALKVLKARYLSILKKCALINAGLFFCSAPVLATEISDWSALVSAWENGTDMSIIKDISANDKRTHIYNSEKDLIMNGNNHTVDLDGNTLNVVFTKGLSTIKNVTLISASASVISGNGNLNLDHVTFTKSGIMTGNTEGSVINSGRYSELDIRNSVFIDNTGRAIHAFGNYYNNINDAYTKISNISDTRFINNQTTHNGGAIFLGKLSISQYIDAEFYDNQANSGGAVFLERSGMDNKGYEAASVVSLSGIFQSNKAKDAGGAIYNNGEISKLQGKFIGNYAQNNGGAIYNSDKNGYKAFINIFSLQGNDTLFRGNRTASGSNAIYNNKSDITLTAEKNSSIIFDDGIAGTEGNITIQGQGTVEFNNMVSGNNISLNSGTLKLGSYASGEVNGKTVAASSGSFDSTVNFNVHGGKLDLTDGEIRETNLGNVNLQEDLELGIDVNLADKGADKITADSVNESGETEDSEANGRIQITEINVTKDMDNNVANVQIADGGLQDKIDVQMDKLNVNLSGDKSYFLTYDQRQGELCFMNDKSLEAAVKHDTTSGGAFAMANDITVETHLGRLGGKSLSVSGNGHTIDGNRYGGFEVFEDQTLTLNDVTLTGFGGIAVMNEGTLNLAANNHDTTIDDEILGSGTINIGGSKTVTLNGMVTHGLVNLTGGRLVLGNEAALHLTRKFTATGGTLDIDTQHIRTDDATFDSGSTLAVTVNPDEHGVFEANKLTVKDGAKLSATLAQGLVTDKDETKTFKLVSAHEWTEANEESNGDNFILAHDNNMYKFEKTDVAGEYVVSLVQTAEEVSQESGGTANNANTANAWVDGGKFPDGSPAQDLANNLAGLAQKDAYAFNNALTALAPEVSPLIQAVETGRNNQIFNAVSARMSGGSSLAAEGKSSGDSALDGGAVWVQLLGNKSEFDGNSKAHGSDAKSAGVAMGAEKQITGEVKVGTGYAYTNTDIEAFHRDIDVDSHSVFAYGEYKPNNWFVNGIAAYSFSDYDESKNAAGMGIKADYGVETLGLQAMTGYNAKLKNVNVTPSAGLRYNRIKRDGYKDTVGQDVSSRTMDVLTAVTGVSVSKEFRTCSGIYWKPEARLAMTYDLTADKDNAVIGLTNGSSYFVEGERLDRFGIEAGLGLTVDVNDNLEAVVGYEGHFREDYTDHTGMISAKYKF